MKVEILDEAERDMIDGFGFYETQSEGLGDYFLACTRTSIRSDSTRVSILCTRGSIAYWPNGFPSPSTTRLPAMWRASTPSWIAVAIRSGFKNG